MADNPLQPDGGFPLDDWSVNTSPFQKNDMDQEYPWEDVDASRRNRRLQKRHPLPVDLVSAEGFDVVLFSQPEVDLGESLRGCGLDGRCDPCHIQVNFFDEVIS